jgi:hypothetical protein
MIPAQLMISMEEKKISEQVCWFNSTNLVMASLGSAPALQTNSPDSVSAESE